MLEFYLFPLAAGKLMRQETHPRGPLQQSVAKHLHLILTTAFGELSADENFGCNIWDHDFDNITSGHKLKELIRQSLMQSVSQYENRLEQVTVELQVRQEESRNMSGYYCTKKRMDISIRGVLKSTNENFFYIDSFFTAPLSYQLA